MEEDTVWRHAHALAKAGISAIPFVGGPLASLLGDYLPNERIRRAEELLVNVDRRLRGVESQLTADEFGFLLDKAVRVAASDHRQFKREMLANILVDAAMQKPESVSVHRLFVELVDDLEPYHVAILRRLRDVPFDRPAHVKLRVRLCEFGELSNAVQLAESDDERLRHYLTVEAVNQLGARGLLVSASGQEGGLSIDANPIGLWMVSRYGLSPLGRRFVNFLAAGQEVDTQP